MKNLNEITKILKIEDLKIVFNDFERNDNGSVFAIYEVQDENNNIDLHVQLYSDSYDSLNDNDADLEVFEGDSNYMDALEEFKNVIEFDEENDCHQDLLLNFATYIYKIISLTEDTIISNAQSEL